MKNNFYKFVKTTNKNVIVSKDKSVYVVLKDGKTLEQEETTKPIEAGWLSWRLTIVDIKEFDTLKEALAHGKELAQDERITTSQLIPKEALKKKKAKKTPKKQAPKPKVAEDLNKPAYSSTPFNKKINFY